MQSYSTQLQLIIYSLMSVRLNLVAKVSTKGAASQFVHLEKFSLNFSSSSIVIRVNLLRP